MSNSLDRALPGESALGSPNTEDYAVAPPAHEPTKQLLNAIRTETPEPCGATLALGIVEALGREFDSEGEFLKMRLAKQVTQTNTADEPQVRESR